MKSKKKKENRGGKRPGAGRKPLSQVEEKLVGANPNRFIGPKKWFTFEETGATLIAGSIWDKKPYDRFKDQQEAWEWWQVNKEKFMKEQEGKIPPGHRPNCFWELEFGISYPDEQLQLIANHNLWRPDEREKLAEKGIEIPVSETTDGELGMVCTYHPFDYPIVFPEDSGVRFTPGESWQGCNCSQRFKKGDVKDIPIFPDTGYLDDTTYLDDVVREVVVEVNQVQEDYSGVKGEYNEYVTENLFSK
jgi:hypothetical protein